MAAVAEKVTVVTGARKGIGRQLAEHFLASGHRVVGCSRGPSDLSHPLYRHFLLDVGDEAGVVELVSTVRQDYGRLDHLINNAGIASMNHSLLTPASTFRRVLETNLVGSFLFAREAAKVMRRARLGRIVNFSTVAVPLNLEGEGAYVASKAAVESMTRVLARELAEYGITVNAIGPTPIATDLLRSIPENKIDMLVKRQAIRRLGTVGDVKNVIEFFLREESSFITGQTIYLGGV